jgi:hypothetical protein
MLYSKSAENHGPNLPQDSAFVFLSIFTDTAPDKRRAMRKGTHTSTPSPYRICKARIKSTHITVTK